MYTPNFSFLDVEREDPGGRNGLGDPFLQRNRDSPHIVLMAAEQTVIVTASWVVGLLYIMTI